MNLFFKNVSPNFTAYQNLILVKLAKCNFANFVQLSGLNSEIKSIFYTKDFSNDFSGKYV